MPSFVEALSRAAVVLLGSVVFALSAWGIARPQHLITLVESVLEREWGVYFGITVRLLLGAALVVAAPASKFPLAFTVLGWIAILAALGLVAMGQEGTRRLVAWFADQRVPILRLWLAFGVAFGAVLVYGAA